LVTASANPEVVHSVDAAAFEAGVTVVERRATVVDVADPRPVVRAISAIEQVVTDEIELHKVALPVVEVVVSASDKETLTEFERVCRERRLLLEQRRWAIGDTDA
jgi:hypothetical protein